MLKVPLPEDGYDVVIVGGSLAGLQAALTLGRACRRILVIDDSHPRNAPASRVNNFLGHDGLAPDQLLSRARAMLQPLDVTIKQDRAVDAEPMPGGGWLFHGRSGQRWEARAVLLATGLLDGLPDIPGLAPLWGSSVVACPHCHGWDLRGEPLAQIGLPGTLGRTVERALLLSRWSQDVVLLTQGEELDDDQVTHLRRASVAVETRELVGVARTAAQLTLTLADGDCLDRRAIFVSPGQRQQTALAQRLGCRVRDAAGAGALEVDPVGRTSVPGVWAAGTTAQPALLGIAAAGAAAMVAVALHAALLEDELLPAATDERRPLA